MTDLRNDPNYIRYYINWTRFLATGLGPMAALVFFNYSIFRGIRSVVNVVLMPSPRIEAFVFTLALSS